jgi:hypothetical protein
MREVSRYLQVAHGVAGSRPAHCAPSPNQTLPTGELSARDEVGSGWRTLASCQRVHQQMHGAVG